MGNINKRSASRSSTTTLKPAAKEVVQLAPVLIVECESRDAECPICFLNFSALNTVTCCNQSICTGCYQQIKSSGDETCCPFCSRASMVAVYLPNRKSHDENSANHTNLQTPQRESVSTSASSSAQSSAKMPDSARTQRSDSTAGSVVTASRSDRAAIEEEIRNQRLVFDEDLLFSRPAGRRSEPAMQAQGTGAGQGRSSWAPGNTNVNARIRTNTVRRRFGQQQALEEEERQQGDVIASLQNLLDASHMDQTDSLEQLEEIMFLEAIRQSMLQAEMPVPAPARAPMPPAPPAEGTLLEQIERALSTPPRSPGFGLSAYLHDEPFEDYKDSGTSLLSSDEDSEDS